MTIDSVAICNCGNPVHAKGKCNTCYGREYMRKQAAKKAKGMICETENCNGPVWVNGRCNKCLQRIRRGTVKMRGIGFEPALPDLDSTMLVIRAIDIKLKIIPQVKNIVKSVFHKTLRILRHTIQRHSILLRFLLNNF